MMEIETMDEENGDNRKRRKRNRPKCKRRKCTLSEDELKELAEADATWEVADVREMLFKERGPRLYGDGQMSLLRFGLISTALTSLVSSARVLDLLARHHSPLLLRLHSLLRSVAARARRLRLRRVLADCVPRGAGRSCAQLIAAPLNRPQLRAFATRLFGLLLSPGDNDGDGLLDAANMQCLCANIAKAFSDLRKRGSVLSRDELFSGIRFSQIRWLAGVHFQLKQTIVHGVLKWLLGIFTHIFRSLFYSTVNFAGKIVHYRRGVWRRICLEGFDLLRAERKLKMIGEKGMGNDEDGDHRHDGEGGGVGEEPPKKRRRREDGAVGEERSPSNNRRVHWLRFVPKQRSMRPIVRLAEPRDPRVRQWLVEVRAVLRFVMDRRRELRGWGISDVRFFHGAYRRAMLIHLHQKNEQHLPKFHFCTADLQNCYTSLNHAMLERFIREAVPPESKFTVVRVQVTNRVFNYRTLKIQAGLGFADALARVRCKRSEQFSSNPTSVELTGSELLRRVRQFAMRTVIKEPSILCAGNTNRPRLFECARGIAQGNPVSVALCNLYLGSMERAIFPQKPQKVLCRRYMDDYVMMAYEREHIEKPMAGLLSGVPRFGLQFGKIVTSFRDGEFSQKFKRKNNKIWRWLRPKEKLQWCGLALNTRTLSLTIDYRRYRTRRPTYTFPPHSIHPSQHFRAICAALKKTLKGRADALRLSARVWPAGRRAALKRGLCRFALAHYARHFCRQLALCPRDAFVRAFLKALACWVFNGFRARALPPQVRGLEI